MCLSLEKILDFEVSFIHRYIDFCPVNKLQAKIFTVLVNLGFAVIKIIKNYLCQVISCSNILNGFLGFIKSLTCYTHIVHNVHGL